MGRRLAELRWEGLGEKVLLSAVGAPARGRARPFVATGGGQIAHPTWGADGWWGVGWLVVPPTPTPPHAGEGALGGAVCRVVRCSAPYDGWVWGEVRGGCAPFGWWDGTSPYGFGQVIPA